MTTRFTLGLYGLVVGATALSLVTAADASDKVRWKMHSTYSKALAVAGPPPHQVADIIDRMSDGDFKIKVFEPGALVAGAKYYDAVSEGSIEAAYGSPGFNAGKNSAYAFFASIPFGPNAGEMMAWLKHGGGIDLARELYAQDNIYFLPCGLLPPETGGWYRKEIKSLEDFKGLKMRFFGLGAKIMEKFGVSTQLLAPGDVYPALELGTIDAAEQSVPAIDRGLGFYQVAKFNYYPGWHQQSTVQELVVNLKKWEALKDGYKAMVEAACDQALLNQFADGEATQFVAMQANQKDGVQIKTYPDSFLAAFKGAWKDVIAEETAANPDSKRAWDSLSAFRDQYKIWGDVAYVK